MNTEDKPIQIVDGKKYYVDIVTETINGKPCTIGNLIPVFESEEERERVKEQIASELYKIFKKYI